MLYKIVMSPTRQILQKAIETTRNTPERCSSNLYSFLATAEQIIFRVPLFGTFEHYNVLLITVFKVKTLIEHNFLH